jgi:enamine deaminase RidA (YjgF/YER057c/UK114 family)
MSAEETLAQMGLTLPDAPSAGGNYLSAKTVGSLVYLAGVISSHGTGVITGTVGAGRTNEDGYAAARACALTQLAVLRKHLGSLHAVPGFADSPFVINGASDLLIAVFGEAGRHVRAAIGVNSLPRNALVELQMVVAVGDL